jgi:hypothetical protein
MRFSELILEDFKTAKVAFASQGISPDEIDQHIANYRELNKKNQFQGDEKNIDWWVKQGWDAFKSRVEILAQTPTKTTLKRSKLEGRYIQLDSPSADWDLFVPLDKEASCNIGKGTDWCTTKREQNYFSSYFYDRRVILVYCIGKHTKYAVAMHKDMEQTEFFTKNDASIKQSEFESKTGMKLAAIREQVMKNLSAITKEQDDADIKDPKRAFDRAMKNGMTPFPAGEKAIASNAEYSVAYASAVLHDRFPLGEPIIARDAAGAYEYAKNVINGRWKEGEGAIAKDANMAYYYARDVIKGRWPDGEPAIAQDPADALRYAVKVLKGRFPLYEPIALKRASSAWDYIKWIIKGPWPEAEKILMTSYNYQLEYEKLTGRKINTNKEQ